MTTLTIRRVPLAELVPDPANARTHDKHNLAAIKESLTAFGQVEPLVVQRGTNRLIAGHGRLAAMQALGWTECDVVEHEVSDVRAAAMGVALNRTAELAGWDDEALAKILQTLAAEDALAGVGYDDKEVDQLLREAGLNTSGMDDAGPEEPPEKPVTRLGDLWILGDHRLLCGDSTKAEDVARVLNGETAALLSTDPPYCVNYTGNDRPIHDGKASGKDWSHLYNEVDIADLGEFLDAVLRAVLPHTAPDAAVYMWHAHLQQPTIAAVFARHEILLHQVLIWKKPCATFGHSYYRWNHEPCAFGWRKGHKPAHGFGQMESVWEADWDGKAKFATFHPTSKPTRLFEIPMEQHTAPKAVVFEPFNGSGSQIIAAEKLGRSCRAIELQPAFVDGTVLRWEKATGKKAVLEATGLGYAETAEERDL